MFRSAASVMPVFLRHAGLVTAVCVALITAGCGGGNRAKDYQPDQIVVFGDENSAFTSYTMATSGYPIQGLVYTVNPVFVTDAYYCNSLNDTARCATTPALNEPNTDLIDAATVSDFQASSTVKPLGNRFRQSDETVVNQVSVAIPGTALIGAATNRSSMKLSYMATFDCTASTTMMQTVAHTFGKGFNANCSRDADGAINRAVAGASIANLQAQVNASLNASELGKGTLVTVWIGQNDIISIYESSTYGTLAAKVLESKQRAQQLANVVGQILHTGAKVVLVGVVDLGFSPYGLASPDYQAGTTSACLNNVVNCNGDLQAMVKAFNKTLLLGDNDSGLAGLQEYVTQGRDLTFVNAADTTYAFATSSSYVNARMCNADTNVNPDGGLAANLEFCSSLSLVSGASSGTYLWADDRHPAPIIHGNLGAVAFNRASNQF